MPSGLEVYDPQTGALLVSLTTRLSRMIGQVYAAAGVSGSVVVDSSLGTPWAIAMPRSYPTGSCHRITISGGTISWQPGATQPSMQVDCDIYYGVY